MKNRTNIRLQISPPQDQDFSGHYGNAVPQSRGQAGYINRFCTCSFQIANARQSNSGRFRSKNTVAYHL